MLLVVVVAIAVLALPTNGTARAAVVGAPTPNWTDLNLLGPSNRSETAFAYGTPAHGSPVALLFGGRMSGKVLSDTWTFKNGVWTQLPLAVHPPPTRYGMMAWDAADNEFVLFGGSNKTAYMNDTWVYKAGKWSQVITPVAPSPRRSGAMVYDAKDGYILL